MAVLIVETDWKQKDSSSFRPRAQLQNNKTTVRMACPKTFTPSLKQMDVPYKQRKETFTPSQFRFFCFFQSPHTATDWIWHPVSKSECARPSSQLVIWCQNRADTEPASANLAASAWIPAFPSAFCIRLSSAGDELQERERERVIGKNKVTHLAGCSPSCARCATAFKPSAYPDTFSFQVQKCSFQLLEILVRHWCTAERVTLCVSQCVCAPVCSCVKLLKMWASFRGYRLFSPCGAIFLSS